MNLYRHLNMIAVFMTAFSILTFEAACQKPIHSSTRINIEGKRWYQLNNAEKGIDALFDGDLYSNLDLGYGMVIKNHDIYYPLYEGEKMRIDSLRMFDWTGESTKPTKIYVIDSNWNRKLIATFDGSKFGEWVGPNPSSPSTIKLDKPIKSIKGIIISIGSQLPSEMEFYGYHLKPKEIGEPKLSFKKLNDFIGINAFEWNFEDASKDASQVDDSMYTDIKNFSAVRHYLDWFRLEKKRGSYTFNPAHSGGWNYDAIYERCKSDGRDVLVCIKTVPDWILASYPDSLKNKENIPTFYGRDLTDPKSYIEQAQLGFQFAARYGSNKNIDLSLVKVNTQPRWNGDSPNQIKTGTNLVEYLECENERDKWWKGRKAYQTAREYAANLSAFYDGHLNTMGPGVGVKNADPNMKVVMAGVALPTTDYLMGMIDWCREFRGYRKDGSINVCWDIVNYHLYTNNSGVKRGVAPEKKIDNDGTSAASIANAFLATSHRFLKDMPVWITEAGYDIHPRSPNRAIPLLNKTALETQADWILRTSLLYSKLGIQKLFFYQLFDNAPNSGGLYATSGLLTENHTRRPAADYLFQMGSQFGDYRFRNQVNDMPMVDLYTNDAGAQLYVAYLPTEGTSTQLFQLSLPGKKSAIVHTPAIGKNTMSIKEEQVINGKLLLEVSETPIFVSIKN